MIRTVVKPNKRNISINLPADFVGKQVEVIAFTIDEATKVESVDSVKTHFASEAALAKDWNTTDEDNAWNKL
ncbi:hypothetical protein [Mucilaginibacter celer]|uniref:DUF2281 domain-containing protein n=1 Tax=Mucilaginibacter celer TaxID=2305508 RepID=A0A494VPS0_9SPHI|nr:hypothetical protein [Mucilaginibacter celer]AYL97486.1 hypothetical protein HYN43_020245 [Mucilaginibacter celer]